MLDRDLAELYLVKTKVLNQGVRRNIERFPEDFMFVLSSEESENLRSQIVTSSFGHGGLRHEILAFTEQGVAMLSSVLRSQRAIAVNIQIMRTFTKLRNLLRDNEEIRLKVEQLERHYDEQFCIVFDAIKRLFDDQEMSDSLIGFNVEGT